jgi:hypothetical protein
MSEVIETQELELREKVVSPIVSHANAINITNAEQYQGAALFLKEIKTGQKKIKEYWKPLREGAHSEWKLIVGKENNMLDPLNQGETLTKNKMLAYKKIEEEKRQAEERRLQAEAEEKARKERERLLKRASKLKTPEKQEEYRQAAEEVEVPVVTVASEVPEIKGQFFRKIWKAKVVDKWAFFNAVKEDNNLFPFIEVNIIRLNQLAQSTKGEVSYPGIKFYEETIMASGGSK